MESTLSSRYRRKARTREVIHIMRQGTRWVTLPVFMSFWFCDLIYAPQHKWTFLAIRCSCVLLAFGANRALAIWHKNYHALEIALSAFLFGNGAIIHPMILLTEGVESPYYAGLNVIAVAAMALPPWTNRFLIANILLLYGPYWAYGTYLVVAKGGASHFIVHNFFIVGTIAVTVIVRGIIEVLRERELKTKVRLHEELRSRAQKIKEKTAESLRLRSLTAQFSPQVVHAIQKGDLNVMDSTHQSEICTIFIDIVNSTDTIRRLSPELTNKTITMFIGDVMRTLLMYDITIDKFLGDGVLAFSNDPVMQKDYVERVIDAALEIRELILSKRSQYSENWGQPLDIRIGIAVGKANVGFYGREEYVRSYTAIGEVVNLASRICLHAQPNQVLISEACAHRLPMGLYSISPVGAKNLKGFGTESVPVFSVSESHRRSKMTHNSSMCPSGHGVLHLATDDAGIYVLMCRVCGYSLQNLSGSDVPSSKKAA